MSLLPWWSLSRENYTSLVLRVVDWLHVVFQHQHCLAETQVEHVRSNRMSILKKPCTAAASVAWMECYMLE